MKPPELFMTIYTTPNEVIALGHLITSYLRQSERIPNKTKEHQDLIDLLERFQRRLTYQPLYHVGPPPPPGWHEVQK